MFYLNDGSLALEWDINMHCYWLCMTPWPMHSISLYCSSMNYFDDEFCVCCVGGEWTGTEGVGVGPACPPVGGGGGGEAHHAGSPLLIQLQVQGQGLYFCTEL